jgi:hypothetical protein
MTAMPTPTDISDLSDSQKFLVLSLSLNNLQNKLEIHDKLLVTGEGSALPVMERIRTMENYIDGMRYWVRFVAGLIIAQTIVLMSSLVWAAIKLLPLLQK